MRLGHFTFDKPMEISRDGLNYLVVESPGHFTKYIQELISQLDGYEGRFTLSENWEEVALRNHVKLIINPLIVDPNERINLNAFYSQLSSIALDENHYQKTMNFSTCIHTYVQELITNSGTFASCMKDFNMSDIFKIMDVNFDLTDDSLLGHICDYIAICRDYGKIDLFVFVNLRSFFSSEDVSNFRSFISYNKISAVLIENRIYDFETGDRIKIIDSDLCEIDISQ